MMIRPWPFTSVLRARLKSDKDENLASFHY